MRVIVCGGRDYNDYEALRDTLERVQIERGAITLLMHGGATGADALAGRWAKEWGIPVAVYGANWDLHGKLAGPIRNIRMLDEGKPDLVVGFPGGAGTADMLRRARQAKVKVLLASEHAYI